MPESPTPTVPQPDFSESYSRVACANCLKTANEPARVVEHNRLAGRILTPKGVTPMQQIHPLDLIVNMLTHIARGQAAILNELILMRTGRPELKQAAQPDSSVNAMNAPPTNGGNSGL